ncbi:MAG: hypothetical protein KIS67_14335 [Verrucomicrobiae bacterium]|nr:hypothetical protein [Verrucomicrobiae bacterium]
MSLTSFVVKAQTYSILHNFGGMTNADGANPMGGLIKSGNILYGTTQSGGYSNRGTVYSIRSDGSGHQVLKHFAGSDGAYPEAGLVMAGATLYGTTYAGGGGTVFRIAADGTDFTVLRIFDEVQDGCLLSGPVLLSGTTLYGTASAGGEFRNGTVFKMSVDGSDFTVLKHFSGGSDGKGPMGKLALSGAALYGVTCCDGNGSVGTLFKLSTNGSDFQVIKHFGPPDEGAVPWWGLVASGTTLYGTTYGAPDLWYRGTVFKMNTDGSDFALLAFCDWAKSLVLSGDTLYGSGAGNYPVIFKIDLKGGGFTALKQQFNGYDGSGDCRGLLLSESVLYGTTVLGGEHGNGVIFSLSLAPHLVNPACNSTNFTFSFQSETGESYTVEYSDDLSAASWLFHHTVTGDGSLVSCCIPMTNNAPRFFRLRLP